MPLTRPCASKLLPQRLQLRINGCLGGQLFDEEVHPAFEQRNAFVYLFDGGLKLLPGDGDRSVLLLSVIRCEPNARYRIHSGRRC